MFITCKQFESRVQFQNEGKPSEYTQTFSKSEYCLDFSNKCHPLMWKKKPCSLNVTVNGVVRDTLINSYPGLSVYLGKQSTISAANPLRFRAHSRRSLWSLECIRTSDSRHTAHLHARRDLCIHEHQFSNAKSQIHSFICHDIYMW